MILRSNFKIFKDKVCLIQYWLSYSTRMKHALTWPNLLSLAHTHIGVLFITIIARIIHTSGTVPAYYKRYHTMYIVGPGKILENLVTWTKHKIQIKKDRKYKFHYHMKMKRWLHMSKNRTFLHMVSLCTCAYKITYILWPGKQNNVWQLNL